VYLEPARRCIRTSPIKFYALPTDHLIDEHRANGCRDGKAIGLRNFVHMVYADQTACPGHVLNDKDRVAGNMFSHVAAKNAGVNIVTAAGGKRDDNAHGFPLEEGLLADSVVAQCYCDKHNSQP
jgi:hypothetical protein